MGSGIDVVKDVFVMVLVDDNFVSIVNVVEVGRIVYSNIIKLIIYLFVGNLGVIVFIVFVVFVGWLNLFIVL